MVLAIKLSTIIGIIYAIVQNSYLGIVRVGAGVDSPTIFGFIMVFFAFVASQYVSGGRAKEFIKGTSKNLIIAPKI